MSVSDLSSGDQAPRPLSGILSDFSQGIGAEKVSLATVLETFHERGFGMILFILALPMALPIPVPPGVNVILALPLILLTTQQMVRRRTIWLPRRLTKKELSADKLRGIFEAAVPWVKRIEVLLRPRLGFLTRGVFSSLIGLAGLAMALAICVPIPLTNTVPSLGIALMAIGVLMRDGLAVLAGMVLGLSWITLLVIAGEAGLRALLEMI